MVSRNIFVEIVCRQNFFIRPKSDLSGNGLRQLQNYDDSSLSENGCLLYALFLSCLCYINDQAHHLQQN